MFISNRTYVLSRFSSQLTFIVKTSEYNRVYKPILSKSVPDYLVLLLLFENSRKVSKILKMLIGHNNWDFPKIRLNQ